MLRRSSALLAILGLALTAGAAAAQTPAVQGSQPLDSGAVAPDFSLPGSTRFGTLRNPVRLSDFHGKTVILAFFYRSRTRG
jgi:hypothetical protein